MTRSVLLQHFPPKEGDALPLKFKPSFRVSVHRNLIRQATGGGISEGGWQKIGVPDWLADRAERMGFIVPTLVLFPFRKEDTKRLHEWPSTLCSDSRVHVHKREGGMMKPCSVHASCCHSRTNIAREIASFR